MTPIEGTALRVQRSLVAAAVALLIMAAVAVAAAPRKGAKFKGTLLTYKSGKFSGPVVSGKFHAPVSFKVSSTGTRVLVFKYGYTGCFGSGGFGTHNPYTFPGEIKTFGPISVSATGSFSAPATKVSHTTTGTNAGTKFTSTLSTTSSLTGRFTSATKASGTITFTQKSIYNGGKPGTCGPVSLTFSATAG
ncbi:MAG: hypothetical protein QOJ25_2308 [Solirubrobacteraceae bacterium]|nr:hypothetical protein [Solirubrobacteraceae bacterium]